MMRELEELIVDVRELCPVRPELIPIQRPLVQDLGSPDRLYNTDW
jgi:hypothetical protein